MIERKSLALASALKALQAVLEEAAKEPKPPIAVVVTDERGDIMGCARMDFARHTAVETAGRKAYTSAMRRMDSGAWVKQVQASGRPFSDYGDPQGSAFQGGVVIKQGDLVIGGIGVSGRTPQEDEDLARAGLKATGLG